MPEVYQSKRLANCKNRNFQPQILRVLEELQRCQWHQSIENPPVFHPEKKFAALPTYDTPGELRPGTPEMGTISDDGR